MDSRTVLAAAALVAALPFGCSDRGPAPAPVSLAVETADAGLAPPAFEYVPPALAPFEKAWLRTLGPDDGVPQPVHFHVNGRRMHAFDLPSEWEIEPEIGVRRSGDVLVVWAYLHEETRLGVSLHDPRTGAPLGPPTLVQGQTFVEELGCGGLIYLNDLVVILAGDRAHVGMGFDLPPWPVGSHPGAVDRDVISVLAFSEPGTEGRWMDFPPGDDPFRRVFRAAPGAL